MIPSGIMERYNIFVMIIWHQVQVDQVSCGSSKLFRKTEWLPTKNVIHQIFGVSRHARNVYSTSKILILLLR